MISNLPANALSEARLRERFEVICDRVKIPYCLRVQMIAALKVAYVIFPSNELAEQINEVIKFDAVVWYLNIFWKNEIQSNVYCSIQFST